MLGRRAWRVCAQVPASDNYYAALNAAVFSDGSFCYIPKGVRCPMEVATYFRINAETSGQVCFAQHCRHIACWSTAVFGCSRVLLLCSGHLLTVVLLRKLWPQ